MTPALLLSLVASLAGEAPSKTDLIKYYPNDTGAVFVIDCEKVLQSKPAKEILGKKSLVEFLLDLSTEDDRSRVKKECPSG